MKRTPLINRHLSSLMARLGHLDEVVIADAGLPIPRGVKAIDLAIVPGFPGFFDVLRAVRTELAVEAAIWAEEADPEFERALLSEITSWGNEQGKEVSCSQVSHDEFKIRSEHSKAIIRTGETTPYANVILISGVVF